MEHRKELLTSTPPSALSCVTINNCRAFDTTRCRNRNVLLITCCLFSWFFLFFFFIVTYCAIERYSRFTSVKIYSSRETPRHLLKKFFYLRFKSCHTAEHIIRFDYRGERLFSTTSLRDVGGTSPRGDARTYMAHYASPRVHLRSAAL